jgi:hypothetical protein
MRENIDEYINQVKDADLKRPQQNPKERKSPK